VDHSSSANSGQRSPKQRPHTSKQSANNVEEAAPSNNEAVKSSPQNKHGPKLMTTIDIMKTDKI